MVRCFNAAASDGSIIPSTRATPSLLTAAAASSSDTGTKGNYHKQRITRLINSEREKFGRNMTTLNGMLAMMSESDQSIIKIQALIDQIKDRSAVSMIGMSVREIENAMQEGS